jgi:UDP-N-acetylmuramoylalanine--D-glutamate ligase
MVFMDESLKDKRVLVLGFARQGKALARWLPDQGAKVTISDRRDMGALAEEILDILDAPVDFALGGHPLELLDGTDILCVSGGVPIDLPIVQAAIERGISVVNDAILFLERCPALVIGITGSAGKTTTTTLVGKMCEADGRKTWVGGNIGQVLLDDLGEIMAGDTVVMELSSFQLEIAQISPDISAVLNVTPNHLDRHGTLQRYAAAKSNIFMYQESSDIALFGADDLIANSFGEMAPARKGFFSMRRMVTDGAFMLGRRLAVVGCSSPTGTARVICERDEIRLRGDHNVMNVLAACAIAGAAGVSVEAMRKVILEFTGVEHRLELVAEIDGVQWINDSIATAPERVIAALRSFEEPIILLAGGRDKDLPWAELAGLAVERCKGVVAFGEHGEAIVQMVNHARRGQFDGMLSQVKLVKSLDEAVHAASRMAEGGDVVLMSPGGTSYDAYDDFAERGEHFRQLVGELKNQRRQR